MTYPENTTARAPELHMLGLLSEGSDGYIGGMEVAGQRQLVASASLPTRTDGRDDEFLKLGFTFGAPNPADPLFREATLPDGWHKESSDHSMWSYVVDDLGRRRVAVFYKAAFYDRDAFMRLETVYGYARNLAYEEKLPAYDDTWCTREVFAEQVSALRQELVEHMEQAVDMAKTRSDDYWPGRAAELKDELAKHDAWAAKVSAS